jgi:uncharacterized hydrophobic protein (TIGR00271 family)
MRKASPEAIEKLHRDLQADAALNLNFLVLAISACIIASLGLLMNSATVIIGAMIIAPLMLPLRGLALAALEDDRELFSQSLTTLGVGTLASVVLAWLVGRVFTLPASEFGTEILARTQPNLADLFVAIAAGAVSGFAKIRPQISDALAGTAISVALMPPLCVVGIALSQGDWGGSGGALLLYLTNLLGITLACMLVFVWGGYSVNFTNAHKALRRGLAVTLLLIIPLFTSLALLLNQKQLQSTIKDLLKNQTITVGQQVELMKMQVNWNPIPWSNKPSIVILTVQSKEPVTSTQVGAIEKFLARKLGQHFKVVFRVSEFQEVTSDKLEAIYPGLQLFPQRSLPPSPILSPQPSEESPAPEPSQPTREPSTEDPTQNNSP